MPGHCAECGEPIKGTSGTEAIVYHCAPCMALGLELMVKMGLAIKRGKSYYSVHSAPQGSA